MNFNQFTSDLTGVTYDPYNGDASPSIQPIPIPPPSPSSYTSALNLGLASFASFQLSGSNTVLIALPMSFTPKTAFTSTSQIRIIAGAIGGYSNATFIPAGQNASWLPQSPSIAFTVNELCIAPGSTVAPTTNCASPNVPVPQQLTIEYGNDWLNSLHLFINPPPNSYDSDDKPSGATEISPGPISSSSFPATQSIFHFQPGIYQLTGNLSFNKGVQLYFDDGAIIKWVVPSNNQQAMINLQASGYPNDGAPPFTAVNANIRGWGIFDAGGTEIQAQEADITCIFTGPSQNCPTGNDPLNISDLSTVDGSSAPTVDIDGITIINSGALNLTINNAQGTLNNPITINNIKIIGYSSGSTNRNEGNSDGIQVNLSQNVNITNSFIRTADDLITIKQPCPITPSCKSSGVNPANFPFPTANVNITHNTLWNEYAHAIAIGPELNNAVNSSNPSGPELAANNIVFDSNTIIHDTGKAYLMGILDTMGGTVQNATFSNNTILEDRALIDVDMSTGTSISTTAAPGTVSGLVFCNINQIAAQQLQPNLPAQPNIEDAPVTPSPIVGNLAYQPTEPFVIPLPNIQLLVELAFGSTYVGGTTPSGGTTPYPQAITTGPAPAYLPPTFSNVYVGVPNSSGQAISTLVSTSVPAQGQPLSQGESIGTDYFLNGEGINYYYHYLSGSGSSPFGPPNTEPTLSPIYSGVGDVTPVPSDEVEMTVRTRNSQSAWLWAYHTDQVQDDMAWPSFLGGTSQAPLAGGPPLACPASPIFPPAQ